MPRSRKVNLEKVQASLDAVCPSAGKPLHPPRFGAWTLDVSSAQRAESGLLPPEGELVHLKGGVTTPRRH